MHQIHVCETIDRFSSQCARNCAKHSEYRLQAYCTIMKLRNSATSTRGHNPR